MEEARIFKEYLKGENDNFEDWVSMIKLDEVLCNCYIGLRRVLLFVNKCIYHLIALGKTKQLLGLLLVDYSTTSG